MVKARTRTAHGRGSWVLPAAICMVACAGVLRGQSESPTRVDDLWDAKRHIRIDEVEPGMEAYCLTDYGENGIEKFELEVLDVIRDFEPGRNAIMVMGLDKRFKHTGPVGGCSGSPVFIEGRLAGAMSFGWNYSKDPLYGVTPIEEMLEVGLTNGSDAPARSSSAAAFRFDLSKPIDLAEIDKQILSRRLGGASHPSGAAALPCPLLISGLPSEACQRAATSLEAMGLTAVPSLSGKVEPEETRLVQGGSLTIPLVTGDMKMEVLGTVTEILGDRVYGFGHSFLGYGPAKLPLAGGKVYTVVSSVMRSFKLGTSSDVIGAITSDEEGAVFGRIGAKPDMIPLSIHVERFNASSPRTYNCQVAYNPALTSSLIRSSLNGAAYHVGEFPLDHTIEYDVAIRLEDGRSIEFSNTSTCMDMLEPSIEVSGSLGLLMNNPFNGPAVSGVEFNLQVEPKDITAYLWSVDVADPKIRAGDEIQIEFVTESFLKQKKKYQFSMQVPENLAPGKYNLMLLGVYEYESFLRKSRPYRFLATNYRTLIKALNETMNIDRTRLYCLLLLPPDGIMLEKAELPSLPGTRAMILQSAKRALPVRPYPHWVEKTVETGTVIADKAIVPIIVEK